MGETFTTAEPRVAIITGGASGFGLAVAQALSKRDPQSPWKIHILDLHAPNTPSDPTTTKDSPSDQVPFPFHFHKCNITEYPSLATVFHEIYRTEIRIDFVFANAGILEKFDFFEDFDSGDDDGPPEAPDLSVVDVNVKGTVNTVWLAMHYFRRTVRTQKEGWEGNLVVTASVGSLYPAYGTPVYAATKHAVLGLARSMAPQCLADTNVRVNSICPSVVRTGIADTSPFPERVMTPVAKVVEAVFVLLDGETFVDSNGVRVEKGAMHERALEVSLDKMYFRDNVPYGDEVLRELWSRSVGNAKRIVFGE